MILFPTSSVHASFPERPLEQYTDDELLNWVNQIVSRVTPISNGLLSFDSQVVLKGLQDRLAWMMLRLNEYEDVFQMRSVSFPGLREFLVSQRANIHQLIVTSPFGEAPNTYRAELHDEKERFRTRAKMFDVLLRTGDVPTEELHDFLLKAGVNIVPSPRFVEPVFFEDRTVQPPRRTLNKAWVDNYLQEHASEEIGIDEAFESARAHIGVQLFGVTHPEGICISFHEADFSEDPTLITITQTTIKRI